MTDHRIPGDGTVPGLVCVDGTWHYVLAWFSYWRLDFAGHDPEVAADPEHPFRDGLHVVGPDDGAAFLDVVDAHPLDHVEAYWAANGERARPQIAVDFDSATFVSCFYDIALEESAGMAWKASYDEPFTIVPPEVAARFPPLPAD